MERLFVALAFMLLATNYVFAQISEDGDFYKVTSIDVQEFGDNLRVAKALAIESGKRKSFMEVGYATQQDNMEVNDFEIDLCVAGFSLKNEAFADGTYSAVIAVDFDKKALENLYRSKLEGKFTNDLRNITKITMIIEPNKGENILEKWANIRQYLVKNKIDYRPIMIKSSSMEVKLVNIDVKKLVSEVQNANIKTHTFTRSKYISI